MAKEGERLLAGTGWLPEPLRTTDGATAEADAGAGAEPLPAFLADGGEEGSDGQTPSDPEEIQPVAVAAE
jgi:ParB family transcriptional regulator, chromosome partitioning protein